MPTLRISIRFCLEHVSKGWFNMEETSFEVYQSSKLKKLMELIKFAMQVGYTIEPFYSRHRFGYMAASYTFSVLVKGGVIILKVSLFTPLCIMAR